MKRLHKLRQQPWIVDTLEQRRMLAGDCCDDVISTNLSDAGTHEVGAAEISDSSQTAQTESLVFIDPAVDQIPQLVEGMSDDYELILLDSESPGIEQITKALRGRTNVASIHLIAHGEAGQISIGNQTVTASTLDQFQAKISGWSHALADGADILLYGCHTGAGTAGEQFVQRLAELSGANIAASTDATGSASKQGDWDLERIVGSIEAPLAVGSQAQANYSSVLPITIHAAGDTNAEQISLLVDGANVATFQNIGGNAATSQFATYTVDLDGILPQQVRVSFDNDLWDPANGIDRNVRIDKLVIDGVDYQTEDPTVFSTGSWLEEDGVVPGFRQSEYLNSEGYFEYGEVDGGDPGDDDPNDDDPADDDDPTDDDNDPVDDGDGSTIIVRASGSEGSEQFTLQVDGADVANFNVSTQQQEFVYQSDQLVNGSQIRVEFTNDLWDPANGIDRNLNVDNISIDDVVFETEDPSVYSTGTWLPADGITPGFRSSESLHGAGYFQYADSDELGNDGDDDPTDDDDNDDDPTDDDDDSNANGSTIVIRAAGDTGNENMRLRIDGVAVRSWNQLDSSLQNYTYETSEPVTIDQVRVEFTNDVYDAAAGLDYNLQVDRVSLDGFIYETEDPSVYSTGTWKEADGVTPGFRESEFLTSNGYFQYSSQVDDVNIGAIALADNFFSVNEVDGSVAIGFVRTLGSDGPITVDYTLFDDSAVGGLDYIAGAGTVVLQDGETEKSLFVTIIDDERVEGAESFTIAIENQTPSALLLAPRTATIEIIDNEDPTDPGDDDGPVPDISLESNVLLNGLIGSTAIDFTPDGSVMYISNQAGEVKVFTNGQLQATPFLDIRSQVNAPRGLLDIAVHPDFENNPYVYLAYGYDPPEVNNFVGLAGPDGVGNRASRVSRVTADASNGYLTAVPGSEVVILGKNSTWENFNGFVDSTVDFDEPPAGILPDGTNLPDFLAGDSQSHTVDAIEFGPDGMLYVSNGDGTSYNQADPRTLRVQDIDNLSGKIIRIDPITGEGLTDNPFYDGDPDSNRSKVYQYGFRNPFRIAIDDVSGQVYVGDVGWSDWEEINAGAPGDNFGWPFYEGGNGIPLQTLYYSNLPEAQAYYATNPQTTPALIGLNHADDDIDAITLGDVYSGTDLGAAYQGSLIYSHLGSGVVNAVLFDAQGDVAEIKTIATEYQFLVQMVSAPDGHLYYVDFDDGQIGYWTLSDG